VQTPSLTKVVAMKDTKKLNEALRLLRVFHDVSRSDLQQRLGISSSFLSEIENGHKNVSIDLLQKYADVFQIPVSSLLFFGERLDDGKPSNRVHDLLSDKVISILHWIEVKEERDAKE